jgi:hypothetical protein
VHLVPGLRALWSDERLFVYAARWVTVGTWAQPDPCAPGDGTCSGGDNVGAACTSASGPAVCTGGGSCIIDEDPSDGLGRYPQNHGTAQDDGYYGSGFASAMYAAYGPL